MFDGIIVNDIIPIFKIPAVQATLLFGNEGTDTPQHVYKNILKRNTTKAELNSALELQV